VLREACSQAAGWRRRFPDHPLSVSVNLATAQTYDPLLVDDVLAVLAETGLPPASLQLELTESAMMAGTGAPMAALRTLAGHDIRIAIDDFGTGYSNLVYLRTMPVKVLKLARQFIDGLKDGGSDTDAHIVATLIRLAHVLDLTVIAEGVETPEQWVRLQALECDAAQGWHLAHPMEVGAIDAMLAGGVHVGGTR
jgi:EAL domain-containing protein (putative c-di-GMP-specific phosphodiesterase class I)